MRIEKQENRKVSIQSLALYACLALLIIFSYGWRVALLEDTFSYDQGIHLILARLWAEGYTPYDEIFVSYPPLFMWSMGVPWKLFGQASALQLFMSTYAITGVIAAVYLGNVYHSRLAGIAAGLLLSFTPAYFNRSITVMGEVPSIGVAVVAIAFAEKYRRDGGWVWLILTGGALAVSLSLKILPFYALPFVGLVVISRYIGGSSWSICLQHLRASQKLLIRDLFILGFSFSIIFLLPVIFFNPAALYDQVVGMRLVSREAQLNIFRSNNRNIINFIFSNAGLAALALYGFVFVIAHNLRNYGLLLVWLIFIWVSMYLHVPLRAKHLPIFLPVLTIFSGFAIDHILTTLKQMRKQRISLQSLSMSLIILLVLVMFSWDVTSIITKTVKAASTVDQDADEERIINDQEALEFINKIAAPTDCVIADDPVFLYDTRHLPPPELSEVSHTRIETGYLTMQDIVQAIQTHQCHVVVALTPRFNQDIAGLPEWLADNYLGFYRRDEISIYFARIGADSDYASFQSEEFGNSLELNGLRLSNQPWHLGSPVFVSLYWQLGAPLQDNYFEKLTLYDPGNAQPVYQITRQPFEGQFNPEAWPVDELARDTFRLDLPDNLPAGAYDLKLSLCILTTGHCIPLNRNQAQDELLLGQITINNE